MNSSAATPKAIKRRVLRERRRALGSAAQLSARDALAEILSKNVRLEDFATVAGYLAGDGEINPEILLARFRAAGADILLPRTGPGGSLVLAPEGTLAATGPAGIPEPTAAEIDPVAIRQPAILLVPSVALTPEGGRLGRGGGFYDRILPRLRAAGWRICGLCHDADLTDDLPLETHDQPMDWCLTEKRLLQIRASR